MSSSGSGPGERRTERATAAEEHLGDRLAAFVDGELADDARERVQSHLATCPQCKAAAMEQRRLKSVVAASELPAISPGLLARLQNLAACGPDGPDDHLGGPGASGGAKDALRGVRELPGTGGGPFDPFDGGLLGSGSGGLAGGSGRRRPSYLAPAHGLLAPGEGRGARGFRVHEVARGLTGDRRSPLDGPAPAAPVPAAPAPPAGLAGLSRRFAFAAAGAFSLAAIAIGSALPMEAGVDGGAHPDDGPAVTPFSANSITTDTHGTTPEDLLDAREQRLMEQARANAASAGEPVDARAAASVSSVTSVPAGAIAQALQGSAGGASGGPMTAR